MDLGFTQPIMRQDRNAKELSAAEAFDDYFFLAGRKYKVFKAEGEKEFVMMSEEVKANIPLNILKVISYFTGVVPLIMLVGKAIARSSYKFKNGDEAATCVQALIRARNARLELQQLEKCKVAVLNVNKEIADTESSHFKGMVKHLEVMQDAEFEKVLHKSNPENKQFLAKVIRDYLMAIGKATKVHDKLNAIVTVLEKPVEEKIFDEIILPEQNKAGQGDRDAPEVSNPMGAPKQAEEDKKAKEKRVSTVPVAKKSAEQMRKEVQEICNLITSKDFEDYSNAMIKLASFTSDLDDMIDSKEVVSLLQRKKLTMSFAPCVIAVQRLARYPLLLKEMKKEVSKMGLTKELEMLDQALKVVDGKAHEADLVVDIGDVKKLIKDFNAAHGKSTSLFGNAVEVEREQSIKKLEFYLNQKKKVLSTLNDDSNVLEEKAKELKGYRLQLLDIYKKVRDAEVEVELKTVKGLLDTYKEVSKKKPGLFQSKEAIEAAKQKAVQDIKDYLSVKSSEIANLVIPTKEAELQKLRQDLIDLKVEKV